MKSANFLPFALLLAALGCGGSDGPPGAENDAVRPCNQGQPSFDVWRANFAPNGRMRITAQVDTRSDSTAAEFRLVVACEGEIVAEEIGGRLCSHDPPQRRDGDEPECPAVVIDVEDIDFDGGFIECFAEIGTTASLDIGTGDCADAAVAEYDIFMSIDGSGLALDLVADDCRDRDSCLESMFGIE